MATPNEIQKYLEELLAETQKLVRELKERGGPIEPSTVGSFATPSSPPSSAATVAGPIPGSISRPPVSFTPHSRRPVAATSDSWLGIGCAVMLAAVLLLIIFGKSC